MTVVLPGGIYRVLAAGVIVAVLTIPCIILMWVAFPPPVAMVAGLLAAVFVAWWNVYR